MDFYAIARAHTKMYPLMRAQDYFKLAYQHALGCGHMITDSASALAYLRKERAGEAGVSFTPIGNGLARMNLRGADANICDTTAFGMFLYTAKAFRPDAERFARALDALLMLARNAELTVSDTDFEAALADYRRVCYPSIHHSCEYRAAYAPIYRVILASFMDRIALYQRVDALLEKRPRVTLSIDGPCASGKTTLAEEIKSVYQACVLRMDDFFLPHAQKTEDRLRKPGGNADHERFLSEALLPLTAGKPFSCRPYLCHKDAFGESVHITPGRVNVIEGSYSQYPTLTDAYDVKVFLTIDPDTQEKRILARNGEHALKNFRDTWIPLEKAYFDAYQIQEKADFTF